MIIDLSVYLVVFAVTVGMAVVLQKTYNIVKVKEWMPKNKVLSGWLFCVFGCVCFLPIIAMFSLRYGIGTDYYSYEQIYNALHKAGISEYWTKHNNDVKFFYVEPVYYLLNRVFPSFRSLQWGLGILIFALLCVVIKEYAERISYPFAVGIFLCTQFIYAMNGTRFSIAVCILLIAYKALSKGKPIRFVILVLCAALFHKSALFCLAMILLMQFKNKKLNRVRDIAMIVTLVSFPLISSLLFKFAGNIPFFERYFSISQYAASTSMAGSFKWVLHIVPVLLPLILFCRKELFSDNETKTMFRICLMEIPFRMLGLYNTMYTRYSRCSQIIQVIFIPLILSKIEDKNKRTWLYIYYSAWFIFYFAYYALVNDHGDSLPYVWVFSQ